MLRHRNSRHAGFALITVLWVLVVLIIMVAGFAVLAHSEAGVANNFADQACARGVAHAGIRDAESQIITLAQEPYTALGGPQLVTIGPSTTGALGDATYTLTIQDEASKVNINTASATLLTNFFPADVAANIVTWRSPVTANAGGADDSYYTTLSPAYHCKYAPFDTIDELLQVKGITADMLAQIVDTTDNLTLRDLLTTSSFDYNTTVTGATRMNINTASATTLAPLLGIPANAIPTRRAYTTPAAVLTWPGVTPARLTMPSNRTTVYDRLTASTSSTLPGLINLNTASATVLAALSGMDSKTAATIVQFRTAQGEFTDVGQLLTVDGLSPALFQRIAGMLTVRSTRFRVFATGQCPDGITATVSCLLQTVPSSGSAATGGTTSGSSTTSTTTNETIFTSYWRE